jgi:subtilisin family serine protease
MKHLIQLSTFFLVSFFFSLFSTESVAQTSYVWDGSSSSAWTTAANWTPSGTPTSSDHVTITSAGNSPVLGANVTVTNFSQTSGTLNLGGKKLTVTGTMSATAGTMQNGLVKKTSTSALTITNVTVNCELDLTAHTITVSSSRFKQQVSLSKTGGTSTTMSGNVWEASVHISHTAPDATLTLGGTAADTVLSDMELYGGSKGILLGNSSGSGNMIFARTNPQLLTITGTVTGKRVTFNKPSGNVELSGTLVIGKYLNLTKGIVKVKAGGLVYVYSGATVSSTSNLSYIDGPVEKVGNQAFTFPVGKNGVYRPISITAPSTSSHRFKAEYFESNSDNIHSHSSKDGSLNYMSTNEYWTLERTNGASTPKVTLSWDTLTSCGMTGALSAIHVAGWNGSTWKDLGNGATTGNINKGTVQTTAAVTSFNMFTLESDNAVDCKSCNLVDELPTDTSQVELLSADYPLWEVGKIYLKIEDTSDVNLASYPSIPLDTTGVVSALFLRYGVTNVERPFLLYDTDRFDRSYRISFTDTLAVKCFIEELESIEFVEYAERVPAMYPTQLPDDPQLANQYYLPLVNLDGASDIHAGGNATVAIVDDAVLTTHEDLSANMAASNWDAADSDTNPNPPLTGPNAATSTHFTHGTHVAGIAGAVTNNTTGVASIGWGNEIMAVKVKGDANFTNGFTHGYDGITWSAVNGADVINNSWGGGAFSQMEYAVVVEARDIHDAVIVAAAGNGSSSTPFYPAAYGEGGTQQPWEILDETLVIAVAALDENNNRSIWGGGIGGLGGSNLGPWVDISAYGTQILSTVAGSSGGGPINNQYLANNGTSTAAPIVSGVAGLMRSYDNTKTAIEIYNCLISTANSDIYGIAHPGNLLDNLGAGRVDAEAALQCLGVSCDDNPIAIITADLPSLCPDGEVILTANEGTSYLWSTAETSQQIVVDAAGIYTVTVTFNGSCTDMATFEVMDADTEVEVFAIENSGLVANDGILCSLDPLFIYASYGGTSYDWGIFGGVFTTPYIPGYINAGSNLPFNWEACVDVTDVGGCVGVNDHACINLQWLVPPEITIDNITNEFC